YRTRSAPPRAPPAHPRSPSPTRAPAARAAPSAHAHPACPRVRRGLPVPARHPQPARVARGPPPFGARVRSGVPKVDFMGVTVDTGRAQGTAESGRRPGRSVLSRVPQGFAVFFALLGALCVLLAVVPPLRTALRPLVDVLELLLVPVSANLAYAVFLFLLAAATAARKKIAWWLVVVYLALLLLADVLGMAA